MRGSAGGAEEEARAEAAACRDARGGGAAPASLSLSDLLSSDLALPLATATGRTHGLQTLARLACCSREVHSSVCSASLVRLLSTGLGVGPCSPRSPSRPIGSLQALAIAEAVASLRCGDVYFERASDELTAESCSALRTLARLHREHGGRG